MRVPAVLFLLALLTSPALAEEEPAAQAEAAARAFVAHLGADELSAARGMLDATMTHALPAGRLKGIWQQLLGRAGAYEAMAERAATRAVGPHHVVDIETIFERSILTLRITIDGSGKVAGFFFIGERPREDDPGSVELETPTGSLRGTIDLPEGDGPFPVVLVIAGSGPTDRDGNSPGMKNDHLKLLGHGLAEQGVAALRYDKRGIAGSAAAGPKEEEHRVEILAKDVAAWIDWLRADERFSRVVVVGHSEGSLMGMLASQQSKPDAFVSIAGPGRPAGAVLLEQLKPKLTPELLAKSEAIVASLEAGQAVSDVPAPLAALFRPSVQPYLISWFAYDPAKEIAKLEIPVLVVQGDTDIQVSLEDARLLAPTGGRPELRILEGMNHVLKAARTDAEQNHAYTDPTVPVVPALLTAVAEIARGEGG